MNKFFILVILATLTSCKSNDVTPGSERVRVMDAEPKGCLYVGEVSSVQDEDTVGTLETKMDLVTRVDLRNKAHALGGNILVFLKGKNTNTLPGSVGVKAAGSSAAASKTGETAVVTSQQEPPPAPGTLVFIATVFKCPASVLNQ